MRLLLAVVLVALLSACHSSAPNAPVATYNSAQLARFVLQTTDMPAGFLPTPDTLENVGLCDQIVTDTDTSRSYAAAVFAMNSPLTVLWERVFGFSSASGASRVAEDFRVPGRSCTSSKVPLSHPTGLKEDVASYSKPRPGVGTYEIGLIRSGSTVTILVLGRRGGSAPAATWYAIVHAAELKVAAAA